MHPAGVSVILALIVLGVVLSVVFYFRVITMRRRKIARLTHRGVLPPRRQLESAGGIFGRNLADALRIWKQVADTIRIDPELMRLDDRFLIELGSPDDNHLYDEIELLEDMFADQCRERGLPITRMPATLREYLEYLLNDPTSKGDGGSGNGCGTGSGGGGGSGRGDGGSGNGCGAGGDPGSESLDDWLDRRLGNGPRTIGFMPNDHALDLLNDVAHAGCMAACLGMSGASAAVEFYNPLPVGPRYTPGAGWGFDLQPGNLAGPMGSVAGCFSDQLQSGINNLGPNAGFPGGNADWNKLYRNWDRRSKIWRNIGRGLKKVKWIGLGVNVIKAPGECARACADAAADSWGCGCSVGSQ